MSDDHEPHVRAGDVLAGKYRVERVLGEGGMGIVFAATHLQLEQVVAIKLVHPAMLKSPTVVERFLREARAAVRLKSAHVARILDVGMLESGAPYMSMEYLEGQDLGQVLDAETTLSVERAADYVVQACEAVAEAHSLGIVHRDLKPQNLFVARGIGGAPILKVLDFGISKVASEAASGLTQSQVTIGSPLYMAPEQMRSARSVDGRADTWAMGVVLYKLLSGAVPFEAETMPELVFKVVNEPPRPLRDLRPDLPPALLAAVARCLEKDPANRFEDIAELAAALEPFAPRSAHGSIDRARQVTASTRRSLASTPSVTPFPLVGAAELQEAEARGHAHGTRVIPTLSSWGHTNGDARSRARSIALGVGAAIFALGGAVAGITLVFLRSGGDGARDAGDAQGGSTTSAAAAPVRETYDLPKRAELGSIDVQRATSSSPEALTDDASPPVRLSPSRMAIAPAVTASGSPLGVGSAKPVVPLMPGASPPLPPAVKRADDDIPSMR